MESAIIDTLQQLYKAHYYNRYGGVWVWQVAMNLPPSYLYSDITIRRKLDKMVQAGHLKKIQGRKGYTLAH